MRLAAAGSGLTFLARGLLRSRSWRALRTLRPGESHIAASRWAGRAGQGRASWTPGAAGLAQVWRPALIPPLVPRTSQWRAVPSHALGCLAPEVAGAGTEGLWGTQSCNGGPTGSRLRRAHPRLVRGSPDGHILQLRHPGLSGKF